MYLKLSSADSPPWCRVANLWHNWLWFSDATKRQTSLSALIWVMLWRVTSIMGTNAYRLASGPLGAKFNEILIKIQTFSLKKMSLQISSAKWRPFCLWLNVLMWPATMGGSWADVSIPRLRDTYKCITRCVIWAHDVKFPEETVLHLLTKDHGNVSVSGCRFTRRVFPKRLSQDYSVITGSTWGCHHWYGQVVTVTAL